MTSYFVPTVPGRLTRNMILRKNCTATVQHPAKAADKIPPRAATDHCRKLGWILSHLYLYDSTIKITVKSNTKREGFDDRVRLRV